ncbi:hypothetical protein [Rhizobium sp. Root1220]|nr:hypothetical protein [Rhizobium sp. Root1220]
MPEPRVQGGPVVGDKDELDLAFNHLPRRAPKTKAQSLWESFD